MVFLMCYMEHKLNDELDEEEIDNENKTYGGKNHGFFFSIVTKR